MMRKLIAVFAGMILSTAAYGADLLECLSPDLVRSIIAPTATNNDIAISTDVPAGLEDYVVPEEFEWIGAIHGETSKLIAMQTSLPMREATDAVVESFEQAGWEEVAQQSMMPSVFSFGATRPPQTALCKNGINAALLVRDVEGMRYVNLRYSAQIAQSSAACRSVSGLRGSPMMNAFADRAPSLVFPSDTTQGLGAGMSSGGSNRDMRTRTSVVSERSPQSLVEVLGQQMVEQGWVFDSSWAGRHGAGATWFSQAENSVRVVGSLEIIAQADDTLDVQFRLREL